MDHKDIKNQAMALRGELLDHKCDLGTYMEYLIVYKNLKYNMLSTTNEELKNQLKSLGVDDDVIKKMKTKKEYIEELFRIL